MKFNVTASAALLLALSTAAWPAARLTQDPLTKLPLPESTAISPDNKPTVMGAAQVCKSSFQGNYYVLAGKMDVALTWYQSHLAGFGHIQSADRLTHVFSDPARSLVVIVTATSDGDADSAAYEVYKPGLAQNTLAGIIQKKTEC